MSSVKVYDGSCHCGEVKYKMRLELPPSTAPDPFAKSVRIYKCNCSTCHKMNMFHCRPIDTYEDFVLISPAPEDLGVYKAFTGKINWYFCKKCGVRPFGIGGNWVHEDLDVDKWAGKEDGEGKTQKVWRSVPLKDTKGFDGNPLHYVSANAVTLDGLDLIDLHDKKQIFYCENIKRQEGKRGEMRFAEPFPGGCY